MPLGAPEKSDSLEILGEGLGEHSETLKLDEGEKKCQGLKTETEAVGDLYFEGMKVYFTSPLLDWSDLQIQVPFPEGLPSTMQLYVMWGIRLFLGKMRGIAVISTAKIKQGPKETLRPHILSTSPLPPHYLNYLFSNYLVYKSSCITKMRECEYKIAPPWDVLLRKHLFLLSLRAAPLPGAEAAALFMTI